MNKHRKQRTCLASGLSNTVDPPYLAHFSSCKYWQNSYEDVND